MSWRTLLGPIQDPQRRLSLLYGLISYGLPTLLGATGIVVLVLWSRATPPTGTPKARVPSPESLKGSATAPAVPGQAFSGGNPTTPAPGPPPGRPGMPAGPGFGSGPGMPGAPGMGMGPGGGLGPPGVMGGPGGPPGAAATTSGGGGPVPSLPGSWPRFRGPDLDNVFKEAVSLARAWPSGGPRKLWTVKLGEGYAGAAIAKSRVYVLDYDQTAKADTLRCFALADGRELWHTAYPVDVRRNHGMSRTVPTVSGNYVVTIGPKCHVMCCDATTGRMLWKIDMVQQWGTTVPQWYAGQCPLVQGNQVILAPGGQALMAAVDIATGKTIWETPNPRGWKMTHASIIPATIGGKKLYIWPASLGVVGVSTTGKLLWESTDWKVSTATVPSAVPIGDGRIFLCGGYNAGAIMFRLRAQGEGFTSEVLYRLKSSVFGSDQHTPILYRGYLYGVLPGGIPLEKQLACLSLDGQVQWTSGPTHRFGLGPYIMAGGLMYLINDQGLMTLAQVSPEGFKALATAKVLAGPDAWGPIAMAGTRLVCRDLTTMVCLDVGGR